MPGLKIATAQFQPKDGDKAYNLSVIDRLAARAEAAGVRMVCFHELCITAYTHLQGLEKEELTALAEPLPGPSTHRLQEIAGNHGLALFAGLLEKDEEGRIYNTWVGVDKEGMFASFRKLHPFISEYLTPGNRYEVFEYEGWTFGILICYDNNVIENVRATTLLGAEVILAPHVTGCTPSPMPGRGFVDDQLWQNRDEDPEALRREFDGRKGREWLMRWLPARAYDNGVYYAFANPIGYDGEQLKNGNALILDPYGDVIAEVRSFEDEICVATLTREKLTRAGGYRYRNARRPELYSGILGAEHRSDTAPAWLKGKQNE